MKPFTPQALPITDLDWEPLIPLIGRANRSLAYYDGILQGIKNPDLLLSPLTTQEAVLSSKIEGTQATLGDVLKFEAGEEPKEEGRRQDIQEIMNYRKALRLVEKEVEKRPFGLNLLKKLHSVLLDSVRGRDKGRGEFRRTQNWIGALGSPIEDARFIPPAPLILMKYLSEWEHYYHEEGPDALVQMSIVHAQFEILHPFLDGNGRLGRMLIPLFLFEKKILSRPMFYLSAYFDAHRDEYIARLRALGQHKKAWNEWVAFFLLALDEQARENSLKAREVIKLYEDLKKQILELTRSQYAVPLLDRLFDQPIFQSSYLEGKSGMPSKPMIMSMLNRLRKANVLKTVREGRGSRPHILALSQLINLCEGRKVL